MQKIFTTSWDDGQFLDKKLAELLKKYRIKGTFYIPKNYLGTRLSDGEIIELAKEFEIGGHTLNHRELTTLVSEEAMAEISGCKKWLEELLNKEAASFCYPRGDFNNETKELVKKAGFKLARTVEAFKLDIDDDYEMPTTLHVYPHPWRKKDAKHYKFRSGILGFQPNKFKQALKFGVPFLHNLSWLGMAKYMFDIFLKRGGVFHLWGHSWEIDKYGMWPDLEKFLEYACRRTEGVDFKTNAEVIGLVRK